MRGPTLSLPGLVVEMSAGQVPCNGFVPGLDRRKITQQLSGFGIAGPAGRGLVEPGGGVFHGERFLAHALQPQILDQPYWRSSEIARDMLAPNERDRVAESPLVQVDEDAAMGILLDRHFVEHGGGTRELLPELARVGPVDSGVVLLRGNRKGKDFLL